VKKRPGDFFYSHSQFFSDGGGNW